MNSVLTRSACESGVSRRAMVGNGEDVPLGRRGDSRLAQGGGIGTCMCIARRSCEKRLQHRPPAKQRPYTKYARCGKRLPFHDGLRKAPDYSSICLHNLQRKKLCAVLAAAELMARVPHAARESSAETTVRVALEARHDVGCRAEQAETGRFVRLNPTVRLVK